MIYSDATIWTIIGVIAVGTYLIRFSFLGLIGDRALPAWLLRLLRYTPVAILPGLTAPLIATPGAPLDPALLAAGLATLLAGWRFRNMMAGIAAGVAVYYLVTMIGGA